MLYVFATAKTKSKPRQTTASAHYGNYVYPKKGYIESICLLPVSHTAVVCRFRTQKIHMLETLLGLYTGIYSMPNSIFESSKTLNGVQLTSDQTMGGVWTLKAIYDNEEFTFRHKRDTDTLKRVSWESSELPDVVREVLRGEDFQLA